VLSLQQLPAFFRPNRNDVRSPVDPEAGVEPSGAGVGRGGTACERPVSSRPSRELLPGCGDSLEPPTFLTVGLLLSMAIL